MIEHMSEGLGGAVTLLERAVDAVLAERPVQLPGPQALARCTALLITQERLGAAALAAVGDVDRRELYALDATGSTRTWLRTQLGGDSGQLAQARRLHAHEQVFQAQASGELSGRGAAQVCSALDKLPDQIRQDRLHGALVDGLQDLLGRALGRGLPEHRQPTTAQLALRAELARTVTDALADALSTLAARLEPVLLLLARESTPGLLGWSLDYLLDALLPDSIDPPDQRGYHLDLVPVLDGDWDLRGHLDHETGTLLAAELARQARIRERTAAQAARDTADTATKAAGSTTGGTDDNAGTSDMFDPDLPQPSGPDARLRCKAQWRHDDLRQLLRDAADRDAGRGQPAPVAITLFASTDAIEGRAGALPGLLITPGQPVSLPTDTLRKMGCHSELTAVLLDAAARPVGTSTTRRTADRRQRAALHALWGPWCAIAGCTRTITVPHHVRPWWLSHQTTLADLLPLCEHDHHDLHEGHRTLRLKDGRHIDQHGWVDHST